MIRVLPLAFIFALFLTALSQSNVPPQKTINLKVITGEYTYSDGFVGGIYKIMNDGHFEYTSTTDCICPIQKESGTYQLKGDLLRLQVNKRTLSIYNLLNEKEFATKEYNLLDPKEAAEGYRIFYNYKGEDVKAEEIKTEYDLQVVRWGERIYLIYPDSLPRFIAAVNLGVEPRKESINENYLTSGIYLRNEDLNKAISSKPMLPAKWRSYLRNFPIKAMITKIEFQDKQKIYTINRGSVSGLKIGMCLVGEKIETDYSNLLWVISVGKNSAKLRNEGVFYPKYQRGEILTTKTIKTTR